MSKTGSLKPMPTEILTVKELNEHPTAKVVLSLVRHFMTSDLAWMYMLFESDTLEDIVQTSESLIAHEPDVLTPEEHKELGEAFDTLRAYARQERN